MRAGGPLPPHHRPVEPKLRPVVRVRRSERVHAAVPRVDLVPNVFEARIAGKNKTHFILFAEAFPMGFPSHSIQPRLALVLSVLRARRACDTVVLFIY